MDEFEINLPAPARPDRQHPPGVPPQLDDNQFPGQLPHWLTKMSPRKRLFAKYYAYYREYSVAIRLSGLAPGTNDRDIYMYGRRLCQEPVMQEAIAYYEQAIETRSYYDCDKVLQQWCDMASLNILDYLDDNYNMKPLSAYTPEQRRILWQGLIGIEVDVKRGKTIIKPKMARAEALEHVGRIMGLYHRTEAVQAQGLTGLS